MKEPEKNRWLQKRFFEFFKKNWEPRFYTKNWFLNYFSPPPGQRADNWRVCVADSHSWATLVFI
jgi:hypothetical protein